MELAQDLRAVHGLDDETELANILSTEILAEINREIVRTVYTIARWSLITPLLEHSTCPQDQVTTMDDGP